jgi:GNAT superfamily N-acetyltransferase
MMWQVLREKRKYLDLKFRAAGGQANVRVIERPGLWMKPADCAALIEDLRVIVRTMNAGDLDYGIFTGDQDRLNHAILTVIYDSKSGRPVGFNALSAMDCHLKGEPVEVVHLGLVVVDPSFRSRGVTWLLYGFTTFLLFMKNRMKPLWISSVTQVPTVVGNVADAFQNVYPAPGTTNRRDFDHLTLAREIMRNHRHVFGVGPDAVFDEDKFVIQNAYTGGSDNLKKTFAQAPKHRNEVYNSFCRDTLDYARGDDVLQIAQIDLSTFLAYMQHSLPRTSSLRVMWELAFAFIEALALPAIHWFSANRPMGDLRPWNSNTQK